MKEEVETEDETENEEEEEPGAGRAWGRSAGQPQAARGRAGQQQPHRRARVHQRVSICVLQTENYDHKLRHYYVTTAPEAECDIRVSPEYPHPSMVMSK